RAGRAATPARARSLSPSGAGVLDRAGPASWPGALVAGNAEPRRARSPAGDARGERRGALRNVRMSKRIHQLAKQWGHNPKHLIAVAERRGIRGKRPQSSLTDEEVTRLRDGLGLPPR